MHDDSQHFLVERRVGRVIEARVWALDDVDAANRYAAALAGVVSELPGGTTAILCADHRFAALYPQPVTDRLLELFRQMNDRLERVAILAHPRQATFYMQLSRLVRQAGKEERRVFRETEDALDHLAPVLSTAEIDRARTFLESGFAREIDPDPGED